MACDDLQQQIQQFCLQYGVDKTYWIAFSGGLDSQVLLTLFCEVRQLLPIKVKAIHINHHLSPNANVWAQFCAKNCEKLNVTLITKSIKLRQNQGESLEELAREERYKAFAELLSEGDFLLTAHQQDDQAETLLLQLFRGAGVKGLASMPLIKPFAKGFHGRPLLEFSRENLQKYAEKNQLTWVDDESNFDKKFTRNFIRHEVLTPLKSRFPSISHTISRTAKHCAEAQKLLDELAEELLISVQGSQKNLLSVSKLLLKNPEKQRLILRYWIEKNGFFILNSKKIEYIQTDIFSSLPDAQPKMSLKNGEIRRFRDDLYLIKTPSPTEFFAPIVWDFTQDLLLPSERLLTVSREKNRGLSPSITSVTVQFRQGGEVVHVRGNQHHSLKNLLQEWGVPPWERDQIPLIFFDKKLISAVGFFIDPAYQTKENETGYSLSIVEKRQE